MLARAHTAGWPTQGYEREEHQVQRSALEMMARWSGTPAARIPRGVDGCGVVVFGLSLGDRIREIDGVPYDQFIVPGLIAMGMAQAAYGNNSATVFQARFDRYLNDVLAARWQVVADEMHADICENGVDARGVFTQNYDTDSLDASLLLLPLVRFLPADDPRVIATVHAIAQHLPGGPVREPTGQVPQRGVDEAKQIEG